MLIHNGYKYVKNRQSTRNIFWRCSKYVKHSCRATVVTAKNSVDLNIRVAGKPHSHPPDGKKEVASTNSYVLLNSNDAYLIKGDSLAIPDFVDNFD